MIAHKKIKMLVLTVIGRNFGMKGKNMSSKGALVGVGRGFKATGLRGYSALGVFSAAPGSIRKKCRARDTAVLKAYRGFEAASTNFFAARQKSSNPRLSANRKGTLVRMHRVPFLLAERGGFEPPNGFKPLHDPQSCAFDQLSHLSKLLE